jgi:hypothetical protein
VKGSTDVTNWTTSAPTQNVTPPNNNTTGPVPGLPTFNPSGTQAVVNWSNIAAMGFELSMAAASAPNVQLANSIRAGNMTSGTLSFNSPLAPCTSYIAKLVTTFQTTPAMVTDTQTRTFTTPATFPSGGTCAAPIQTADARPTPQLDLSGLSVIPAPAVGATAGTAGIDLKGKNLPTVASVTVAGKDGKVVTSTETALKLELPTLAPGSYDIVMKTEGNGSITIQNGLVIAAPAPKVDPTPIPPVVITPSVPRTTLVAASTPVPGFLPGKAGVSEAQKAIIQDVVLTKNVTSLECVGVTNAKVSAKLASARAASICAAAKAQNAALTTSVKTIAEAKVNGPIGSVLINYNH